MRLDEYKTVTRLWKEKLGLIEREEIPSKFSERGTLMEDDARAEYIRYTGNEMIDVAWEHDLDFIRASLDGYNAAKRLVLEIKCPSAKVHYETKMLGKIKPSYYCQMQHQLLASGSPLAHFWSFDGVSGHLIEVPADLEFQEHLKNLETLFWHHIKTQTPPNPKDFHSGKWFPDFKAA